MENGFQGNDAPRRCVSYRIAFPVPRPPWLLFLVFVKHFPYGRRCCVIKDFQCNGDFGLPLSYYLTGYRPHHIFIPALRTPRVSPTCLTGKTKDGVCMCVCVYVCVPENSSAIRYSLNSLKTSTQQATYRLSAARLSSLRPDAGGVEPTSEGAEPPAAVGD